MADGWKQWVFHQLEENRGLVILFFVLPASFLFDLVFKLRRIIFNLFQSAPELHDQRVKDIQKRVTAWTKKDPATRKKLVTSRPNWLSLSTTFFRKDLCEKVPVSLYDILSVDEDNRIVRVEPMVRVGDITTYLLSKGYMLSVNLEIDDATVGGLALGTGMTTRSHKVGLYQETIKSFEVVLGDGSLVKATKDNEYSDLFQALPWSHGSLGFLVALELEIIPVKPFVHLKYHSMFEQKKYCDFVRDLSGANNKDKVVPEFLEATIFSKDEAVVMVGNFANSSEFPNLSVNHIGNYYKPWFYEHVRKIMYSGKSSYEELIPVRDYLLRHNRSIFWVVKSMIPFGNNLLFRIIFGWLLPPKPAFLKFSTTPGIRELTFTKQVFQDIVLPLAKLEDQINKSEELFDLYPLLVYACRVYDHGPSAGQVPRPKSEYLCPGTNYAMYNDLGVYGVPGFIEKKQPYNPVYSMRAMEKFTRDIGGFSFLYADIFMTEEEFEEMFDMTLYKKVRSKYSAQNAFPELFDKVRPEIDVLQYGTDQK